MTDKKAIDKHKFLNQVSNEFYRLKALRSMGQLPVLNNAEIRNAIRNAFEELPKDEIVTEEIFVRVFTETLNDDDLRQRFDIPLDPVLFAMVGYGIFKMGIREYCGGNG